jgi:hypothetical protein
MTYEVQTYTLCDGWINMWTEDDTILTFDTHEGAEIALKEHLEDLAQFVKIGHLQDFNPEDYRIERIAP